MLTVPGESAHLAIQGRCEEETLTDHRKEARQSTPQAISEGKFDARAFVFSCLQENPDLKLSEIEQLALAHHQDLSQPTISRYRKLFFARSESSSLVEYESSAMQVESSSIDEGKITS